MNVQAPHQVLCFLIYKNNYYQILLTHKNSSTLMKETSLNQKLDPIKEVVMLKYQ